MCGNFYCAFDIAWILYCVEWIFSSSCDDDDYEDDDNDDNDNGKDTHDEYQHKIRRILLISTHFERLSGLP